MSQVLNSMRKILTRLAAAMLVVGAAGCQTDRWDLGAPEVLRVSDYELATTPSQGTAAHRVEEVWIYSTTDVVGVYPLPATVALPAGEEATYTLVPGLSLIHI